MRCLITHKWFVGGEFEIIPYYHWRQCNRCGKVQRGIYDRISRNTYWETVRERVYVKPVQIQIARRPGDPWETERQLARITPEVVQFVRKPSSRLDKLAHTLRLRRTRMGDVPKAGNALR